MDVKKMLKDVGYEPKKEIEKKGSENKTKNKYDIEGDCNKRCKYI